MRKVVFLLSLFLLLAASPLFAQEIYLQGGGTESTQTHDPVLRWGLEYVQGLSEHWAAGLTHINEGHIPNHHRDGYEPQIWLRTNVVERKLWLAAGVGPYLYFDTTNHGSRDTSYDAHGWGTVFSLAATWYTESRFLYQIRANYINAVNSFDSVSVTAGIGYQLDAPATRGPLQKAPPQTVSTTGNEITVFAGDAVLNQSERHHSFGEAAEYRRGVAPHLDVTVGFLNEGPENDDRFGATAQIWAVRSWFDDKVVFGIGVGPYLARDEHRGVTGSTTLNALIGLTAGYSFSDHWVGRFIWDRVLTNYSHDADVWLAGLGYRF